MDNELHSFAANVAELQKIIETLYGKQQNVFRNNAQHSNIQHPPRSSVTNRRQQNVDPSSSGKRNRRSSRQKKSLPINNEVNIKQKLNPQNSSYSPSTSKQKQTNKHISSPIVNKGNNDNMPKLNYRFVEDRFDYSVGRYVKSRNTKAKYIRLRTFLKKHTETCIFETEYSLFSLVEDLKKLDVSSEQGLKNVLKKYPRTKEPKKRKKDEGDKTPFPDYITEADAKKGLENGSLIKGIVRINPKNIKDAYVNNEDSSIADYYLPSVRDRNRALESDEVVLEIKPEKDWINGHKTAIVVYLMHKVMEYFLNI